MKRIPILVNLIEMIFLAIVVEVYYPILSKRTSSPLGDKIIGKAIQINRKTKDRRWKNKNR
ncbi:MAG: hypothetical protein K8H86_08620 [Ignavibacteriaceae bacterium]|nr:hypothetical protein [Ignavibacteriaceae bacterium]